MKRFNITRATVQICLATVTLMEIIQNKHDATVIKFISSFKQTKKNNASVLLRCVERVDVAHDERTEREDFLKTGSAD